jgi:AcrR family transcriptional regulator
MDGIAEAAEVSVKTIYRHFENKDKVIQRSDAGGMRRQWDSHSVRIQAFLKRLQLCDGRVVIQGAHRLGW